MKIMITAKGHPNQEQLQAYYRETLLQKYDGLNFINAVTVTVKQDTFDSRRHVSVRIDPVHGHSLYAECTEKSEHSAFKGALKKVQHQLERYKETHYKSSTKYRHHDDIFETL